MFLPIFSFHNRLYVRIDEAAAIFPPASFFSNLIIPSPRSPTRIRGSVYIVAQCAQPAAPRAMVYFMPNLIRG